MYYEENLIPDSFFSKMKTKYGNDTLFRLYRTYRVCLKKIAEEHSFIELPSVSARDLDLYVSFFNLEKLRDLGVSNEQLLLIVRNIENLIAFSGTVDVLRLIGIIKTGGNSLIFKDAYTYDGKIRHNKEGTYGDYIATNDEEIIFVNGAFLISLISGTPALKALIDTFKSHRDFVQIQ